MLMDELDIHLKMPRVSAHQKNRSNPNNINNCEDYFRITIFIGDILPKNVFDTLDACCRIIFPTIKSLISILASLPISTASAERSFSTLRRLKT
ncbi:unnamed protein product [Macrosiphum euphorbiae]|nr:unnamed protein product [Macrosiphum euphorbiae]